MTAANVNLKTQSYTGRADGGGVFNSSVKSNQSAKKTSVNTTKSKKEPSPEGDVVQLSDDVIDIRSTGKSDFD